jgi:hypothetical protein
MTSLNTVDPFDVPQKYNWKISTSENYKNRSITEFVGKYVKERKKLDYTWHTNYTRGRQEWQDKVIDSVVRKVSPQSNPWIVYVFRQDFAFDDPLVPMPVCFMLRLFASSYACLLEANRHV